MCSDTRNYQGDTGIQRQINIYQKNRKENKRRKYKKEQEQRKKKKEKRNKDPLKEIGKYHLTFLLF